MDQVPSWSYCEGCVGFLLLTIQGVTIRSLDNLITYYIFTYHIHIHERDGGRQREREKERGKRVHLRRRLWLFFQRFTHEKHVPHHESVGRVMLFIYWTLWEVLSSTEDLGHELRRDCGTPASQSSYFRLGWLLYTWISSIMVTVEGTLIIAIWSAYHFFLVP